MATSDLDLASDNTFGAVQSTVDFDRAPLLSLSSPSPPPSFFSFYFSCRGKGVYRCRFRCLQMSMSNVDRVPCKCRWKCRKYIDLSRGKSPKKPEAYVEKMQNHILIFIHIYILTHTHTHKKAHFSSIFTRKSANN